MWATRDEFQFAWRKMTGDFIVRTHAAFVGAGVDPHRKIGWIVRRSLDADSAVRRCRGAWRRPDVPAVPQGGWGGDRSRSSRPSRPPTSFSSSAAAARTSCPWPGSASHSPRRRRRRSIWATTCTSGLFVCSHNPKVQEQAVFSNVRIVVPPKAGWTPYRDYIGSNLEIMTVASGARTVLHTVAHIAAGAELDHRWQGADLQQRGQALSIRPGHARGDRDEHRLCDPQQQRPCACRLTGR